MSTIRGSDVGEEQRRIVDEYRRKRAESERLAMSKVLAKFRVTECVAQRVRDYVRKDNGEYGMGAAQIVSHVKLAAVQGEPFGEATPSGSVDMLIKNPTAARVFQDAWDAYVRSEDPEAQAPEFYLMLQLDHGKGWED